MTGRRATITAQMARRRNSVTLALALGVAALGGCRDEGSTPKKEDPVAPPSSASATTSGSSAAAIAPATVAVLGAEELLAAPKGAGWGLYAIEGAIVVTEAQRVGRLVTGTNEDGGAGATIEWIGKIPKGSPALGDNILGSVHGRWPDAVGAMYTSSNGRALTPTYMLLTGKQVAHTVAPGGGLGWIAGVATVGESVVVAGWSPWDATEIYTLRGPKLPRHALTQAEACKEDEYTKREPDPGALSFYRFGATSAGTFVALGGLCDKRGAWAEIWDPSGTPRIVDLRAWWKETGYATRILTGPRDELWAVNGPWSPILHYLDGKLDALPDLDRPLRDAFVSPRGELHATDGETIYRVGDGRWTALAKLEKPSTVSMLVLEGDTFLARSATGIARLRETARAPLSTDCAAPFVYLYEVSDKNAKDFDFPSTRKALAAFPEASSLRLVEFEDGGRQLGVSVATRAQGEALVAHVKATMKDEKPRLLCHAPKTTRAIELEPKGK